MKLLQTTIFTLTGLFLGAQASLGGERPNILFFLCDDLGYGDVGVFYQNARAAKGEPAMKTPHIDKLANEGIQLRAHYVGAPVCAPSRATLFLGQSQGNSPVRNNQFDKALPDQPTLASTLKEAGYNTALIGKWGLQGDQKGKKGVDAWPSYPTKRGFNYFIGYVTHVDGHEHYPFENIHFKKKAERSGKMIKAQLWEQEEEIADQLEGCYTTDLFTAATKRFITTHVSEKKEQPFFLMLSYDTPHAATQIATMPYPEGFGVDGGIQWVGEKGKMINTANSSTDSYIHPDYADKDWQDVYKRYASSVRRIDNSVADVMQTLKDLKLDENTLVVFSSDHGPSKESYITEQLKPDFFRSFGPFTGIKRDCWEGGIRPGAIARWPAKIKAGSITETPSQMQDWMPTFCEVAEISTPAIADGVSLIPQLTGTATSDPDGGAEIYVEYYQDRKTPDFKHFAKDRVGQKRGEMQSIRKGKYKAIRYNVKKQDDKFLVFDLTKDPSESTDIAGQEGVPNQQYWIDAVSRHHHRNPSAKRPYDGAEIAPMIISETKLKAGFKQFEAKDSKGSYVSRDSFKQQGFIKVDKTGEYKFTLPQGIKGLLRIHRINVLDRDSKKKYSNNSTLNLEAGLHPFTLYLKAPTKEGVIKWKPLLVDGSEFVTIPLESYFHQ